MHKPGELVRKYEKGYGEISLAIQSLLDFIREQAKQNAKKRRVANKTIRDLKAERDAALSTIEKVEALHHPFEWSFGFGPVTSCKGCADQGVPQENASWPCPTARALGSVPSTGEGNEP